MSSYGKSSYSGKTQSSGVSWYNHVSRKFMIPYGIKKREDYFEEKELLGIMKPNTCELLTRPSIGMSEFGEAVEMSPPLIESLRAEIDLDEVIDHLYEVKDLSEMFNNRGNCPQAPTESDLKRLIRFMIEPNERMEQMLNRTEEMAMYLYTTINNIRQVQLLMMNPEEFTSMSQHEQGKDGQFKRKPTLEGMVAYLKQEIFGTHIRTRDVRSRERLLRELDDSGRKRRSTEQSEDQPRSNTRRTSRRRSPSPSRTSEEEQRQHLSNRRGKSTRKTGRRGYSSDQQSHFSETAEVLRTSSSEKETAASTRKSSRRTGTTKKQTRSKRASKTDVSHSEEETRHMERQEESKGTKRKTRVKSPVRVSTASRAKRTRVERTPQRTVPQSSTRETEQHVHEARASRTRTAATTGRQRISKHFEQQSEEEEEEEEERQECSQSDHARNERSSLQTQAREESLQISESEQSHDSDQIRREMVKTLSSARPKATKQSAVKTRSPVKRSTTSKKQAPKARASKKTVQVTRESPVTDPEDNETLASLQEKRTKEKTEKLPPENKDSNDVEKKYTWVRVQSHLEEDMFITQKMPTAEHSQMTMTQQTDYETSETSENNDEKE